MARKMRLKGPLSILVTSDQSNSPERLAVMRGIHAVCRERQWLFRRIDSVALRPAIKEFCPDAIIFALDEAPRIAGKTLSGQVVISAGHDLLSTFGWPSVVPDDHEIGRQAAHHLLDRGLRSLAAFGGWHDAAGRVKHAWAFRRVEGFVQAAKSAGIVVNHLCDSIFPPKGSAGHDCFRPSGLRQWVMELPKPVGILVPCDGWGSIVTAPCLEQQLRVPEDVAIVTVGDCAVVCEMCDPPLSSVVVSWERLGRVAAELAANAVAGKELSTAPIIVPPAGVTARRSSDVMAVDDPDVAAALSIIFAHADRPLSVAQILRRVPSTQRRLERHFKKAVGRRMVNEIRRVHVEQAKRLLAESDLPMPFIARSSGFKTSPGLAVAFRQETGTTPSKFRRRHRPHV